MLRTVILPLALVSTTALAGANQTQDPLQVILDKLDSMEKRIQNLEGNGIASPTQQNQPQVTPSPSPAPTSQPQASAQDEMVGGMVIKIMQGDDSSKTWMKDSINSPHFAGYVSNSSIIKTPDIYSNTLGYKGAYALTAEGYIKAEESGLYTIGMLHRLSKEMHSFPKSECFASISINGSEISQNQQKLERQKNNESNMLIYGSVELEPGLYEFSASSACNDHKSTSLNSYEIERSFMIKTPSDLSMRIMEQKEVLHKK